MNIAKSSKFNIKIDYDKSHGCYLYDKITEKEYLDFFGMYASLPLGYNHEIFQTKEFVHEILRVSKFKVNNCEFVSDESLEFDHLFSEYCARGLFKKFHYACTGALAIEAAIKTAIEYKKAKSPRILSFHNSFHGINSYGGFVTSRFPGADIRLNGFPEIFSTKIDCDLEQVKEKLLEENITCILMEPIQCSAGDIHHDLLFFEGLRALCNEFDVPLIFDEIQIGFGGTGKLWYYEHLTITPDIVVFGKKTQLSGIMVKEEFATLLSPERGVRLEVTWDGDVVDMVRCKHIIKHYQNNKILESVLESGKYLMSKLKEIEALENVRGIGLIVGFDLKNNEKRDKLMILLYNSGLICNSTGEKSIRLRPALNIGKKELDKGIILIKEACREIGET